MIDLNNIPDANESWLQAEKMLDKHFRLKRIVSWLLILVVPALVGIGAYTYFLNPSEKPALANNSVSMVNGETENNFTFKGQSSNANPTASVNSNTITSNDIKTSDKLSVAERKFSTDNLNTNSNTRVNTTANINSNNSNQSQIASQNSSAASNSKTNQYQNAHVNNTVIQNVPTAKNGNIAAKVAAAGAVAATASKSDISNDVNISEQNNTVSNANTPYLNSEYEKSASVLNKPVEADRSDVFAMNFIHTKLPVPVYENDVKTLTGKPANYYNPGHVSFQISAYGGVNYVTKTLSVSNDWQNYLQHRQKEEENIFTPAFGVSLTASMNKLAVSLGAEYAVYGEKTNYYPYTMQKTLVDNGNWNLYSVAYTDTDTAYVTGNRYFVQTQQMRTDSTYDSQIDTVEEYKYDENVAKSNGVNRISYFEVPIMFTYNLISGKAGLGISAGLAPGWLSSRSGYYISTDARGVESLEEIDSFRKFMLNGRVGVDFYYRMSGRMCFNVRPQIKTNLNSVFEDNYGVNQKYTSAGVLFGVSWILN